MKLYHFIIIFVIIGLSLIMISDVKTDSLVVVVGEKENLDYSFQKAIDDGVYDLVEIEGSVGLKVNKERGVENFFTSMFASMNLMDNPEKQTLLMNYVPVIVVTTDDGYYLYYSDEYKGADNYTYISKRWSEKMPYYYEDEDFIYGFTLHDEIMLYDKNGLLDSTKEQALFTLNYRDLKNREEFENFRNKRPDSFLLKEDDYYVIRKERIIHCIEESMTYYCNLHNDIAKQYGISYHFAMPIVDNSEWIRSIDNPSMIVMFQGYPLVQGTGNTYNRFVIAGARITKNHVYYLEQKSWYFLYHTDSCTELEKGELVFLTEPYYTVYDCVKQGAYACKSCIENGVFPPDYSY